MAVILNNKKSTYGSPYCFYTLEYTNTANRTAISVDITFKVTSHLQYNNSSFGTGRTLKAQIYINGSWRAEQTLKSSSDSWSGTGNHTKTFTLTVNDLNSTDTTLSNIKFKVNSNATDNACQLSSTSCSDITIPIGHTPPIIFSYTMTEASNSPVKNIVDGNVIAENLSIKQFEVNCQLSDSATPLKGGIYNNIYPYSTTDITIGAHIGDNWQVRFNLDCSQFSFVKSESDNSKIPIVARIIDSEDTQGVSGTLSPGDLYTYIPYTPPTIIESSINAKRTYQVTGNAVLSLEGTYYKSTDVLNQSSHITVGYKYWENKENPTIPSNYTNIPNTNVTINNNGTFTISNYSLGNSFELNKSYKIKLKVTDQYKSYELSEPKTIPYGEALWTEYKDRVDFKKLTINKEPIITMQEYTLYTGATASNSVATLTYNIAKTGYTPISITGISCEGTRSSFINIYASIINNSAEAEVRYRNTNASSALVSNDTLVRIIVAYIKD